MLFLEKMSGLTKEQTTRAILKKLFENEIFAQCPECKKYLSFFEVYNNHCEFCGMIEFNDIILIDLFGIE